MHLARPGASHRPKHCCPLLLLQEKQSPGYSDTFSGALHSHQCPWFFLLNMSKVEVQFDSEMKLSLHVHISYFTDTHRVFIKRTHKNHKGQHIFGESSLSSSMVKCWMCLDAQRSHHCRGAAGSGAHQPSSTSALLAVGAFCGGGDVV